jgi:hypothetical protein
MAQIDPGLSPFFGGGGAASPGCRRPDLSERHEKAWVDGEGEGVARLIERQREAHQRAALYAPSDHFRPEPCGSLGYLEGSFFIHLLVRPWPTSLTVSPRR